MIHPPARPPRHAGWRALRVVLFVGFITAQGGGCAAIPIATLGTLVGVTASAVSTGTEIYRLGKLDTAEMARFADAAVATREAAADLGLRHIAEEQRKKGVARFSFADRKGASLTVQIEPRTAMLMRVGVDVGWFGSEATARLFLSRLRAHLPPPAFPSPAPDPAHAPQDLREAG